MWHDRVQRGKIVSTHINLAGSKQRLKCWFADANVETEHTWTVKIGNAVILVVRTDERCEWQRVVRAVEEERIAKVVLNLDLRKCVSNILRNERLIHRSTFLS